MIQNSGNIYSYIYFYTINLTLNIVFKGIHVILLNWSVKQKDVKHKLHFILGPRHAVQVASSSELG
jgi:hypothetical protein